MNYRALIARHYPTDSSLRRLLLLHSGQVCRRALDIARRHPELGADLALVEAGAMLHDIGIYLTSAPAIHCHGTAPYLMHGPLGAQLLRAEGHEALARICERHTGTGLTAADIRRLELPLPAVDLLPETPEERIICYADLFHSKSHPLRFLTPSEVEARWGSAPSAAGAQRWSEPPPQAPPKSARRPQALPRKALHPMVGTLKRPRRP